MIPEQRSHKRNVDEETNMIARPTRRLVREGALAAEVDVDLLDMESGWTPCLSVDDAYKLDDVRNALRAGDVARAARLGVRVYRLTPVDADEPIVT